MNIVIKSWRAFLHRVLKIQIGRMHYLRLNIDIERVKKELEGFDLQVKELTYEDFLKGDSSVFHGAKLELMKVRCSDPNYHYYGIIENDRLIYSTGISTKYLGLPIQTRKPIKLMSHEGLLEDSYCDPIARGRGLHGKMNWYRILKLYEMGKTHIIGVVLNGNKPAFKVQFRCGFEELGTFYCGKIFGINYTNLKKSKFDQL